MNLNNGTFIGFTELELIIIVFILLTLIYSYSNLKSNKKAKTIGLSLDELIKQSKETLEVDKLTEADIEYLKDLGTPEEQNKKQETLIEIENRNAITTLYLLIPGLMILLVQIEYMKYHNFTLPERDYYIGFTSFILGFLISTTIAINYFINRKKLPPYIDKRTILHAFLMSITCGLVIYLYIIGDIKIQ